MSYERITERVGEGGAESVRYKYGADKTLGQCLVDILGRLAELEDKIEDGQAVILPCKVGDTVVYKCQDDDDYRRGEIVGIAIEKNGIWFHTYYEGGLNMWHKIEEIGQTVFFTEEAAEAKLKELRGDK